MLKKGGNNPILSNKLYFIGCHAYQSCFHLQKRNNRNNMDDTKRFQTKTETIKISTFEVMPITTKYVDVEKVSGDVVVNGFDEWPEEKPETKKLRGAGVACTWL